MVEFVDRKAMVGAAEREVREEASRHPDDPWTLDWARQHHSLHGDQRTSEFAREIADARKRLRNELLAIRFKRVEQAANARDRCEANGWGVPLWARNTLKWAAEPEKISALYFDENDETENLEDALTALSAALR